MALQHSNIKNEIARIKSDLLLSYNKFNNALSEQIDDCISNINNLNERLNYLYIKTRAIKILNILWR